MAETVGELLVKIGADVGDLKAQLADVGLSLDKLTRSAKTVEGGFTTLGASTVVLNSALELAEKAIDPLIEGLRKIAEFVEESVSAAGKEETAQLRLAATLQATGNFSEELASKLRDQADALQRLTGVSSEAITEAQALFFAFGASTGQIEPLTRAAISLSKAFGGDLADNARKLITDINGESDALGRLGIKHDEGAGKAQRFADVLAFTSKVADPTQIKGYEQSISALSSSYEDVQKAIGKAIISVPEFQALLTASTEALTALVTTIRDNQAAFVDFVGGGITLAIEGLGLLETATANVVKVLELAKVALSSLSGQGAQDIIEKLGSGESLTPLSDSIAAAAQKTAEFQVRVEDLAAGIRDAASTAKSKEGIGGITDEATKASASLAGLGSTADSFITDVATAGKTTADAFAGVPKEVSAAQAAFTSADESASAFSTTGANLGPIFDEARGQIVATGQEADQAFSSIGDASAAAAAKGAVLADVFDKTREQAKTASDAIGAINETLAGLRLDDATAGLPGFNAALIATAANIAAIGDQAKLTGPEMAATLGGAADAVAAKFEALGREDVAGSFRDLQAEIEGLSFAGIDVQLATFLVHLDDLSRQGKLSIAEVGEAAEEAQKKFAALASQKALGGVDTAAINANATALAEATNRTAEFQQRVADLAAGIRAASDVAQGKDGIGGITDATIEASAAAKELAPVFKDAASGIQLAGESTAGAFAGITDDAASAQAAFAQAANEAAAFGETGGRLGPIFDEAGKQIVQAGEGAKDSFTAFGSIADTAATKGAVLSDVFDKTREQANTASDAIAAINETLAGLRLDDATAGLPAFDAALIATAANISAIGEQAKLTGPEMAATLGGAADAVAAKFEALARADVAKSFRDLQDEVGALSFAGIDVQLATFLVHLDDLGRQGKLSIAEVGEAAEEAQKKFAALASQKALGGVDTAAIRANADALAEATNRTAEFQQRVADLAAGIRAASSTAQGKDGIAGITAATQTAGAAAAELGPVFKDAAASITLAGESTAGAFEGVSTDAASMVAAFSRAADEAASFGNTGGRLGPIFDEAGKRIIQAGEGARDSFTAFGSIADAAASKGAVLSDVFDRTRQQAKTASDAIRTINEVLAGLRLDAATAGLPAFDAALAATDAQIRKIGAAARLTGPEMESALGAAADAVRTKFEALGRADVAKSFTDLDLEIQKVSFRGIDDQLATFLIHLEQLRRDGKLSLEEVGQAADQARIKIAEFANQKALGDVGKAVASAKAETDLFGSSVDGVGRAIDIARQKMIDLKAAGDSASPTFEKLSTTLSSLETTQKIEFDADISSAEASLSRFKADIAIGAPPFKIAIDEASLDRDLAAAQEKASHFLQGTPLRVAADLEVAGLKSLADVTKELAKAKAGADLFGRSFDGVGRSIEDTRDKMLELADAGGAGTVQFKQLGDTLNSLEKKQTFEIDVDTRQAESSLDDLRRDVAAGAPPFQISLDEAAFERSINAAKARAATLLEGTPARIQADLDVARAQAEYDAFKKSIEEGPPVNIPTDLDPKKKPGGPLGFPGQPFFTEHNAAAATPDEIGVIGQQFKSAIDAALKDGNAALLATLRAQGEAFLKDFEASIRFLAGSLGANQAGVQGVTAIREALNSIQLLPLNFTGALTPGLDLSAALRDFTTKQTEGSQSLSNNQTETNSLLRENNDMTRASLEAIKGQGSALSSGRFVQGITTAVTRNIRTSAGNPSLTIGG